MEVSEIIGLSSSGFLAVASLIFTESIKEIIKKFFSVKSKKEINKLYWFIFLLAIAIPLTITYFPDNRTKSKTELSEPINPIQPLK